MAQSRYPLAWALYETFRFDFWLGGLCQLVAALLQVITPFTLRFLIAFSKKAYDATKEGLESPPIAIGMGYVLGISAMQIILSLGLSHFTYRSMLIGGQSRSALIALLLEKSLKLSMRAKAGGEPDDQARMMVPSTDGSTVAISWRADPEGWSNGRIMNCKLSSPWHCLNEADHPDSASSDIDRRNTHPTSLRHFSSGLDFTRANHSYSRAPFGKLGIQLLSGSSYPVHRTGCADESYEVLYETSSCDQCQDRPESQPYTGNAPRCSFYQIFWLGGLLLKQVKASSRTGDTCSTIHAHYQERHRSRVDGTSNFLQYGSVHRLLCYVARPGASYCLFVPCVVQWSSYTDELAPGRHRLYC